MSFLPRLTPTNSILLVIDIQEKLLVKMPKAQMLIKNVSFLLDVAHLLEVPVLATEQYPKGLGPTTPELIPKLPAERHPKVTFSSATVEAVYSFIQMSGKNNIILAGMETHICILQTGLDLLARDYKVFIPVDAVSARYPVDDSIGLTRLDRSGAMPTTVESIAFEWLGTSEHPHFKAVSKLVQDRLI